MSFIFAVLFFMVIFAAAIGFVYFLFWANYMVVLMICLVTLYAVVQMYLNDRKHKKG